MTDVRIRLFGTPRIERDGTVVDLGRRKAMALAAYLAAAGGSHGRQVVTAMLWPENDQASARAEMRRALSQLTAALGPGLIDADRSVVSLNSAAWVDVARFRSLLAETRTHGHDPREACARCLPLLAEAAELGAEDFMSGFSLGDSPDFDDWVRDENERLRAERADVLHMLSSLQEHAADRRAALETCRRWLALDPLCEPAHRQMMSLYAGSGQRSAALRQYQTCIRVLREEAGSEPESETTALWEAIRDRRFARPSAAATLSASVSPRAPRRRLVGRARTRRPWLIAAGSLLIVFVTAGAVLLATRQSRSTPAPIAVLPLVDSSGLPGQEWFAYGMTEAVLTELAGISGFRVTSHESVRQYAEAPKPVAEIRKELGIDYLVEGSVLKAGDMVRIAVQLIDARTDTHMWAASYERPWADIISLQKEIAGDVSEQVQVRLTAVERQRLASRRPVVPAAFQASLDGMFRMQDLWSRESFQRAVDTFKAAVARDPGFAPAWVGLANCYWGANQFGVIPTKEAIPGAREAANRAVTLDGSSAAAHTVLAFVHYLYDRDPAASEREFRTALRLAPSSVDAHRWYGSLLSSLGRHAEAIAEVEKARDIDPRDLINRLNVAARLYYARQYDAAIDEAMVAENMAPGFYMPLLVEGWAYTGKKDYTKAITALTQSAVLAGDTGMEPLAFLGYVLGRIGRTEEARATVAKLDGIAAKGVEIAPFFRAEPLLGIGETERALDWIEKACNEGDLNLVWNFQDPVLDSLRSHPRFVTVKKKLGL